MKMHEIEHETLDSTIKRLHETDSRLQEAIDKIEDRLGRIEISLKATNIFKTEDTLEPFVAKAIVMSRKYMGLTDFKDTQPRKEEWMLALELWKKSQEAKK